MHIGKGISQSDRQIIGYSNPILPSLSLSQTIVILPEFNNQSMGMGHILPLGIQNNWGNQMVAKDYQIQSTSSYFDNLQSSNNNYNKCIPNSMGSNISSSGTEYKNKQKKRNKEIISRREK
jgi:hypothetical protein